MGKRRWFWLVVLLLAVMGGGGYFYYTNTAVTAAEDSEEDELQTAVARQGDLVVSATGAGVIIPAQQVNLSFAGSGHLREVMVRVGDEVVEGALLARLDDRDAQQALLNAQLQLAQATMQTDAAATETGVSYDDIAVAQAQINLDAARADLDDLLHWEADPDEIALLEANVAAAEAAYNAARGQEAASSTNITVSNINLEQAQRDLASAQTAYEVAWDPGREWELNDPRTANALEAERSRTTDALQRAQDNLDIAQLNVNASVSSTNVSSSTNAQSNLLNAQQALAAALAGPTVDEIAAAEMALRQTELAWQQALLNQESNGISLAQAELNVAAAETAVADTTLTAPMAGTVTAVNFSVGETVSGGVIVLADLTQPLLEVYLDETDLDKVGMGYEVEVVLDAFPDETFSGQVVQVDPQLVTEGGVTAVRILVQMNYAKPQTLPIGLNATVEVIGGRAQNAVLVPVEALREISPGQYALFVMENGEPVLRMVEVGLMDFSFAEIISGVEAGEEVTTGIVQTQ